MGLFTRSANDVGLAARGHLAYHAGLSAEDQVAARYRQQGHKVLHKRWRAGRGELDLVIHDSKGEIVFVEVKKSRTFDRALTHLSPRQAKRIFETADRYLGELPNGALTPSRVDVALVNEIGEIRVIENFFGGGL